MSGYDTDAQLDRINTAGDHSERKIGLSHRSMILRLLKVNCNLWFGPTLCCSLMRSCILISSRILLCPAEWQYLAERWESSFEYSDNVLSHVSLSCRCIFLYFVFFYLSKRNQKNDQIYDQISFYHSGIIYVNLGPIT